MGHARPRPKRLAAKLFLIRRKLGLSQPKLAKVLGIREYTDISKYERDVNEAPLHVLLAHSRAIDIPLERIVDDELPLVKSQSEIDTCTKCSDGALNVGGFSDY